MSAFFIGKMAMTQDSLESSSVALLRLLPGEVSISSPDGGYFLWLEFDPRLDSRSLHARALASGFSLAPGALFSSKGLHNHCLRLNSSHP